MISAIIPLDEEAQGDRRLLVTLLALARQAMPVDELVIVSIGSRDLPPLPNLIRKAGLRKPAVRIVVADGVHQDDRRNLAMEACSGDLLLLLREGDWYGRGFLERLVPVIRDQGAVLRLRRVVAYDVPSRGITMAPTGPPDVAGFTREFADQHGPQYGGNGDGWQAIPFMAQLTKSIGIKKAVSLTHDMQGQTEYVWLYYGDRGAAGRSIADAGGRWLRNLIGRKAYRLVQPYRGNVMSAAGSVMRGAMSPHRIAQFTSAVTGPKVESGEFECRLSICKACDRLRKKGEGLFCGACGCGQWRKAELNEKLWYDRFRCPLGRFGHANGEAR